MHLNALEIKVSHLHADARGQAAFIEDSLSHVDGHTSLCYFPRMRTVKGLVDDVKDARKENKL